MKALISLILGLPLAWVLLALLCELTHSFTEATCGHNAALWVPLALPIAIFVVWFGISKLQSYRSGK